ncbi:hypothetical protein FOMPIDRAFT_1023417 [Fomitopsis schrenkii]|uniref:Uncharacterized protein n=1 Tax=Fomitopsis schrenkii TaxID=2126942 RepID=S8ECW5_FOMSC|nr:hypothetical protein FOMPIDRAFT_1023417 [Fomitopsis schrenkii]
MPVTQPTPHQRHQETGEARRDSTSTRDISCVANLYLPKRRCPSTGLFLVSYGVPAINGLMTTVIFRAT